MCRRGVEAGSAHYESAVIAEVPPLLALHVNFPSPSHLETQAITALVSQQLP
jgi:hypothetical protein